MKLNKSRPCSETDGLPVLPLLHAHASRIVDGRRTCGILLSLDPSHGQSSSGPSNLHRRRPQPAPVDYCLHATRQASRRWPRDMNRPREAEAEAETATATPLQCPCSSCLLLYALRMATRSVCMGWVVWSLLVLSLRHRLIGIRNASHTRCISLSLVVVAQRSSGSRDGWSAAPSPQEPEAPLMVSAEETALQRHTLLCTHHVMFDGSSAILTGLLFCKSCGFFSRDFLSYKGSRGSRLARIEAGWLAYCICICMPTNGSFKPYNGLLSRGSHRVQMPITFSSMDGAFGTSLFPFGTPGLASQVVHVIGLC